MLDASDSARPRERSDGGIKTAGPRFAISTIPWRRTFDGWLPDPPPWSQIYAEAVEAGFSAIATSIPSGTALEAYRRELAEAGLSPGPGHFAAPFSSTDTMGETLEAARLVASEHAALAVPTLSISDLVGPRERLAAPGLGVAFDRGRLDTVIENLAATCRVMVAEGVRPALHQNVASWIETGPELEQVLREIPDDLLAWCPDIGHLSWAGIDPAERIARDRSRVGLMHIKDLRREIADDERRIGSGYRDAIRRRVYTEPGRGSADLDGAVAALVDYAGWVVLEIDLPSESGRETAATCADWVGRRFGSHALDPRE